MDLTIVPLFVLGLFVALSLQCDFNPPQSSVVTSNLTEVFVMESVLDLEYAGWELGGFKFVEDNTQFPLEIPDSAKQLPGKGIWFWSGEDVGFDPNLVFNSRDRYQNAESITIYFEYFARHSGGNFSLLAAPAYFFNGDKGSCALFERGQPNVWSRMSFEVYLSWLPINFKTFVLHNDIGSYWLFFNRIEVALINKTATTLQPTTEAETTHRPTTEAETTHQPSTEAETTLQPTPEAETTRQPSTEAETTRQPTTEAETNHQSATEAETTHRPTTEAETTHRPTTEAETTSATTLTTGYVSIPRGCSDPLRCLKTWGRNRTLDYRNIKCIQDSRLKLEVSNNNVYSITNMFSAFRK